MAKKKKVTKADFRVFKAECERLIDLFGLTEWDISIVHGPCQDDDWQAQCSKNVGGRVAELRLADTLQVGPDYHPMAPEQNARHEVVHLLLAKLSHIGRCRWASDDEYYEAEEEICRRLEKVL